MNQTREPLLSIIIPTKNREKYALSATEQILSIPHDNIQLIIQNNSDTNILENMLEKYKDDKRLIYNYQEGVISTIDNFSQAIERCEGEYVCAIGDDDGVNRDIIKIVEWAKQNKIDAVKPGLQFSYFWPESGATMNNGKTDNGILTIAEVSCKARIRYTKTELQKLMADGCQNYLSRDLVKLYHGIVRRVYMGQIKQITGSYFGGLAPDIYSCIALSTLIERVVSIDYPLTFAGACKKSSSADSATGRHTGKLEDAPHFTGHNNYNWAIEVPKFYSVETIWADSGVASVKDMKRIDLLKRFDCASLANKCFQDSSMYSELIKKHYYDYCNAIGMNKAIAIYKMKVQNVKTFFLRGINFTKRKIAYETKTRSFDNIPDIVEAEKVANIFLLSNNITVDKLIDNLNHCCRLNK